MALLESCTALSKSFSSRILFENISLGISEGERLGLIDRNGSGKTTLLKILSGRMEPDSGAVSMRRNTHVGYVPQDSVFPAGKTVAEIIAEPIAAERLDDLERAARINLTLGRAGFTDGSALTESLSGGWKRRLAIARELAGPPDLLFLDEPTNHLDLEGILWLEKLLSTASFASVVVSHDRYFLDNVVNDMAEIDRVYPEGILRVEGGYSHFLETKEAFLLAQSSRQESLANVVRREVEWLRRGPKARTGKSRARISTAVLGLDGEGGAQLYADYWQWEEAAQVLPKPEKKEPPPKAAPAKKKLSYLEAREWEQMEPLILEAERGLESIRAEMHSPEIVSDAPRPHISYHNLPS